MKPTRLRNVRTGGSSPQECYDRSRLPVEAMVTIFRPWQQWNGSLPTPAETTEEDKQQGNARAGGASAHRR